MDKSFWKYIFSKKEKQFTIYFTVLGLFFCGFIIVSIFCGEEAYFYGGNAFILILDSILLLGYYIGSYIYWKKKVKIKNK